MDHNSGCVMRGSTRPWHHASLFQSLCPWFVFLLLISSCTTVRHITGEHHDRDARIINNVPFYPQEDFQCGPASLSGVMNYWGAGVTPGDIAHDIYSRSARGTLTLDMVLYAQGKGLEASQYQGGYEDLKERIDHGYPLIVLVDYGFSFYQVNHFMVIIGYSEEGVIVNSGKEERAFIPLRDFLASWGRTKFWTLLLRKQRVNGS